MKFLKGLIGVVILAVLINGGLWLYWKNANSEEHAEVEKLEKWFDKADETLSSLEKQAGNTDSDEEYDAILEEYNTLSDEYNKNIGHYNESIEVLNDEFYLIPFSVRGSK
ncbi:hypothetical protein ACQKII_20550 [Lysinibacillus sp. NPDC048646]|uniref:hypothetical protein n=1 Tax=Lysinibacillus sp. NPDC048646 TaxID=3390574 RepID=UPI003D0015BD